MSHLYAIFGKQQLESELFLLPEKKVDLFTKNFSKIDCKFYRNRKIYVFRKKLKESSERRKIYVFRKISGMGRSPSRHSGPRCAYNSKNHEISKNASVNLVFIHVLGSFYILNVSNNPKVAVGHVQPSIQNKNFSNP